MPAETLLSLLDKYGIPLVIIAVLLIGIAKLFKWHDRRENERMRQHSIERETQSKRHVEETARAYDQFQKALSAIVAEMRSQGEALTHIVEALATQKHEIKEIRSELKDVAVELRGRR